MPSDNEFPPQKRKRGWAGEELEIAHQREKIRESSSSDSKREGTSGSTTYSTVNLELFRNREVGQGYQARGVVRQRTGMASNAMYILDMTKKSPDVVHQNDNKSMDDEKQRMAKKKNKKQNRSSKRNKYLVRSSRKPDQTTEKYIADKGIREFRQELHKILCEAQKSRTR